MKYLMIILLFAVDASASCQFTHSLKFDHDLNVSDSTKLYMAEGREGALWHNKIAACAMDKIGSPDSVKANREEYIQVVISCLTQNMDLIMDSTEQGTTINALEAIFNVKSGGLESLVQQVPARLDSMNQSSLMDSLIIKQFPKGYNRDFARIDSAFFKNDYPMEDTTFINRSYDSMILKADRDTTLSLDEKRLLINFIQFTRYDRLLWCHYKEWRYQFRYEKEDQ